LARRTDEVEQLIRGVSGFVSYCLVRTADGGFSVSVFEDRAGTEESNRRAAERWAEHGSVVERGYSLLGLGRCGDAKALIEGEAIFQLSN